MMPVSRRAWVVSLILLAIFCIVRAPVSLVTLFLPQSVQLKGVEGSLWHGRVSAIGLNGQIIQEAVTWRFEPRSLLSVSAGWALSGKFGKESSLLNLVIRPRKVELQHVDLALPLEPFTALHPDLKSARFGALVHLRAAQLSRGTNNALNISIERLSSPLTPSANPLGNYQVTLNIQPDLQGNWQISPAGGVLSLTGQGPLNANLGTISGQIAAKLASPVPGLSPMLSKLPKSADSYLILMPSR